ncbi:MAG: hypothetical protein M3Z08_11585 [Chloroflexota bacterium]|nr:hypothetical protein [Chloroflexota bacterium]
MACSACRGSGRKGGSTMTCYTCNGVGAVPDTQARARISRRSAQQITHLFY